MGSGELAYVTYLTMYTEDNLCCILKQSSYQMYLSGTQGRFSLLKALSHPPSEKQIPPVKTLNVTKTRKYTPEERTDSGNQV